MFIGPIQFEAKIHLTDKDNARTGVVSVTFNPGKLPTLEQVHRLVGKALAAAGDEFRLLDASEFFNQVLIKEQYGRIGKFALPADFAYDTEAVIAAAQLALQDEIEERRSEVAAEGSGEEYDAADIADEEE